MIAEGFALTIIGMTVVFLFLVLLVGVMYAIAFVGRRVAPAAGPAAQGGPSAEIAVAIAAAHVYAKTQLEQEQ